jgi:hypothetical protein
VIGPGLANLDFSLFKNNRIRRISENFNVQFRAEFFNVFNRANFASPVDNRTVFEQNGSPTSGAGLITSTQTPARDELYDLAREVSQFRDDPLGFVLYCYPWGQGELADFRGPDANQREFLESLGKEVRVRAFDGQHAVMPIRMAESSGHGTGTPDCMEDRIRADNAAYHRPSSTLRRSTGGRSSSSTLKTPFVQPKPTSFELYP